MLSEKFETVLSLLDNPKDTMELIIIEKPVFFSLIIFTLSNVSFLLSESTISRSVNINFIFILLFILLFNFLILITTACSYHFIAEIFKGDGDVITLFILLNFSLAPTLLLVPSAIIGKLAGTGLVFFAFTVITLWTLYLSLLSIKTLYNLSTFKTILVVLSPFIVAFLLFVILLVIAGVGILSLFI